MEATVVFTDEAEHWLASRLRPGYRHVFCAVPSPNLDGSSVIFELQSSGLRVAPVSGLARELSRFYRQRGLEAWTVPFTPWKRPLLPMMLNSCVGFTKYAVGLRSFAITPWQLRCYIAKEFSDAQTEPDPAGPRWGKCSPISTPAPGASAASPHAG